MTFKYTLKLFNTESRSKEEIKPLKDGKISMYTCGPTVYDYAHIGNFRTYVFEDLLRKTIKFLGYEVEQAMNFTDVDDKTIRCANENNISLEEYTDKYKKSFLEDIETLGIENVEHRPEATKYIKEMIEIVTALLSKGYAYKGKDGSIYYSISKFKGYGRLSKLPMDSLKEAVRDAISNDEYNKENASDFVLWKSYDAERDGNIFWESPFGRGRPGWHLECSAMAINLLGETIDIHVGGVDNIFPHHENEIAQSEAYTGRLFAKYWVHSEHLLVENKKMSKSSGNFYTLRDLLGKGYTGQQIRYMLIQTHYRMQLNFTIEELEAVKSSLERIHNFIGRLKEIETEGKNSVDINEILENCESRFIAALSDDLNISVALATVFNMIREINIIIDNGALYKCDAILILDFLTKLDAILGIFKIPSKTIPENILEAARKRDIARQNKDWALADEMRDLIISQGYFIEDTPNGSKIKS